MKYLQVVFALFLSISLAAGQYFASHYAGIGSPRVFGLQSLAPELSSVGAYSAGSFQQPVRDARQDRGPVVFPQPPADAPEESSGVIIGASGYGFVPPNSPQYRNAANALSQANLFDQENEIRSSFDAFGPSSAKLATRLNRYSNRYYRKRFPFF